ncbi:MAG TPA: aminoglycoside phosphotransferase family protein [Phycisphaerales bacterium]|nr:aminoglycoside phosphotransferase family protein [Phycisphaerales bacterium]HRQ74432.1 aminoglycoside phosphotransferase family protein [Phycisphaerales bacterium]
MTAAHELPVSADARTLAASLAPLLAEACDGRLGEIRWFKADWQRGGAATGRSTWRNDDGSQAQVIVKLPIVQRERTWTVRLQEPDGSDPVVPRLYASGEFIGGYDLAWIIIEYFDHGPLGVHWHDQHVPRIAEALARFHARAAQYEVNQGPRIEDWHTLVDEAIENIKINHVPDEKRWSAALKTLRANLDRLVQEWRARAVDQWLHGDCHFANAMSRVGIDEGPVTLIDLAEVHAGNWIEDAVYFERQLWARPERMKPHKPVKAVAAARKAMGLPVEPEYARLAMIRRALLAGTAPKFIRSEGNPAHLGACLDWIERAMNELKQ